MSGNSFGHLFQVSNFGESHGPAIGCVIDGCPPGMALSEADIQPELDRRRPGTSRHVTQRNEPDQVQILSGVYEGKTTGTPIALLIHNTEDRFVDPDDADLIAAAYGAGIEIWRPVGDHVQSRANHPEEYRDRLLAFLGRVFSQRSEVPALG